MALTFKARVMDQAAFERTLIRIAHQIIEKNNGVENLCLIGIKTRGIPLAHRLSANIQAIEGVTIPVGELDITRYRDDLTTLCETPTVHSTHIPFALQGKTVVLVDDVIFTCRTARAALDAIMSMGRPARVQLFCMIDRGHAQLPIKANFVGKNLPTSLGEVIRVRLNEVDGVTDISILQKETPNV